MKRFGNQKFRLWLYAVVGATLGVLGVYGVVDDREIMAWNFLGAAICGIAAANTTDAGANDNE